MIKHIGKHNNRKIVVVFRKVPGEDHLALVVYTDLIPTQIHDDIMKVLVAILLLGNILFYESKNQELSVQGIEGEERARERERDGERGRN